MQWPPFNEYINVVQNPGRAFTDVELQDARAETNGMGLPKPISGNFGVVFRMNRGAHSWAVKCFTRSADDQRERFAAISDYLTKRQLPLMTGFAYQPSGIRVLGTAYPVLKMQWIAGLPLGRYIEANRNDAAKLRGLAQRWLAMLAALSGAGIAHGDLQLGNVLLAGDELKLIDYDGMFVPALAGRKSSELGVPNFQHPGRDGAYFDATVDRFAGWVIYLSLIALAEEPALWDAAKAGQANECLLFRKADYAAPADSAILTRMAGSTNANVRAVAAQVRFLCEQDVFALLPLPSTVGVITTMATVTTPTSAGGSKEPWWKEVSTSTDHATAHTASFIPPHTDALIAAVSKAVAGDTLHLAPGIHRLTRQLVLDKPITLTSAGGEGETVEIVGSYTGPLVSVTATSGEVCLSHLGFRRDGGTGPVLYAAGKALTMQYCTVSGGKAEGTVAGLWFAESVVADIRNCRIADNNGNGVAVEQSAKATIIDCTVTGNQLGVTYFNEAGGLARGNTCTENSAGGILVMGQATPIIRRNCCIHNAQYGIYFTGNTIAVAEKNTCEGNMFGIIVSDYARPTLRQNNCRHNGSGVAFFDFSAGIIESNRCYSNDLHGICVTNQSHPTLTRNFCEENSESGIAYFEQSAGIAERNSCVRNAEGIDVANDAQPQLWDNNCSENTEIGIVYGDTTGGIASGNSCTSNGVYGIVINENAQPQLRNNLCQGNTEDGIAYGGASKGAASGNTCKNNGNGGIYVRENAQPQLRGNYCIENRQDGISYRDTSAGIASGNTCTNNGDDGIYVEATATPTLIDNVCSGNTNHDIRDDRG